MSYFRILRLTPLASRILMQNTLYKNMPLLSQFKINYEQNRNYHSKDYSEQGKGVPKGYLVLFLLFLMGPVIEWKRFGGLFLVNAESETMKEVEHGENKLDDHLEEDGKKKKHRKEKIGFRDCLEIL